MNDVAHRFMHFNIPYRGLSANELALLTTVVCCTSVQLHVFVSLYTFTYYQLFHQY